MPTREPTKINMKFKEEKSNPSSAAPTIKSSASTKINKKAPKKQVEKPEEFMSEEADLCFVELIKERLEMGRKVQYYYEAENENLKSENEELKQRVAALEKELKSVKDNVMSTLNALGSVDLDG